MTKMILRIDHDTPREEIEAIVKKREDLFLLVIGADYETAKELFDRAGLSLAKNFRGACSIVNNEFNAITDETGKIKEIKPKG